MKALRGLLRSLLLSLGLCLVAINVSWAVPTLSLSTTSPRYPLGEPFTLSVDGSGFTDLFAYQFDLVFDPTLFQVASVNEGPFLATAGSTFFINGFIDNTTGVISFVADSLFGPGPGASGSGVLATIDFVASAINRGTGLMSLANVIALDSNFADIAVVTVPVEVTVPEPGSVLLLLAGLLTLAGVRTGRRWQS